MKLVTRRKALTIIGGAGVGVLATGCGSSGATVVESAAPPPPVGTTPKPDAGVTWPSTGEIDGGPIPDAAAPPDAGEEPELSSKELLSTIDTIVVVVMENRSFDHFFGALAKDATYPSAASVDGLSGTESNPASSGNAPVTVFKMDNFTPQDPPHDWASVHAQWDNGANDGFVKAHAGASENEVMGYHDRTQLPFYYWLADNYTICDRWFCSVLGPTWPNRYYIHAATSNGKKDNTPPLGPGFDTVWDRLKAKGKTYRNYYDGPVAWYVGAFLGKLGTMNPTARIDQFFADAKDGVLPSFSLIDPDFTASDDHPSHNIQRGQAFVASIYKALAASPQWSRCLLVITYDEHGGFYDHVPPPAATDANPEFAHMGFRVPAIVVGPTVRKGYVTSTVLEHSSIAATLATRFEIASLSKRMDDSSDIACCIDPKLYKNPSPPPANVPAVPLKLGAALYEGIGESSQPTLDAMIASGQIPEHLIDRRSPTERIRAWLSHAERLGAVRISR
jgi:phospholipase C